LVVFFFFIIIYFIQIFFTKLRCQLLESLVKLFELPEDDSTPDDEHYIEIEDTPGIVEFKNKMLG
jgi:hypothetical protein